ncbi:hypothetical protein DBIPINDM_000042 [Mesorhizobium sp. AR02]|uniref:hypothetical protein n=1 Tax=Mesorhizobium sp. AR02 TaxID=2865837 RepID=UPI0021605ADA|nr:hypothetical protein [Mesorhizobium sp. AR02]UVK53705.1 hypothetical protein DBIPINDM_000042 [Mesorhizobium sp. AR02]
MRVIMAEKALEGRCLTKDGRGVFFPTAALSFRSGKIADRASAPHDGGLFVVAGIDPRVLIVPPISHVPLPIVAPANRSQCGVADCCVAAKGAFGY